MRILWYYLGIISILPKINKKSIICIWKRQFSLGSSLKAESRLLSVQPNSSRQIQQRELKQFLQKQNAEIRERFNNNDVTFGFIIRMIIMFEVVCIMIGITVQIVMTLSVKAADFLHNLM